MTLTIYTISIQYTCIKGGGDYGDKDTEHRSRRQINQGNRQGRQKDMGSRSEYFRRLALADLERRRRWVTLFNIGNKVGREMGITSETQAYELLED